MGPTHGLGTKGPVRVAVIIPLCTLKPKPAEELSRGWGEVGGNRRAFCPHPPSTDLGPSTPCRRRGSYSKGPSVPQPLLASLPKAHGASSRAGRGARHTGWGRQRASPEREARGLLWLPPSECHLRDRQTHSWLPKLPPAELTALPGWPRVLPTSKGCLRWATPGGSLWLPQVRRKCEFWEGHVCKAPGQGRAWTPSIPARPGCREMTLPK